MNPLVLFVGATTSFAIGLVASKTQGERNTYFTAARVLFWIALAVLVSGCATKAPLKVKWMRSPHMCVDDIFDPEDPSYFTLGFRADGVVVWDKDKKFTT